MTMTVHAGGQRWFASCRALAHGNQAGSGTHGGAADRGARRPRRGRARRDAHGPARALPAAELAEFAYEDSPLPIDEGQTISQPYIVALMTEALELGRGDRVLEIGTGSGYAAAVLARHRARGLHDRAPRRARRTARRARLRRARLRTTSTSSTATARSAGPSTRPTTRSWSPPAGPTVPEALLEQLAVGGRLVIPIGADAARADLVRVTPRRRRAIERRGPRRRCASSRSSARRAGSGEHRSPRQPPARPARLHRRARPRDAPSRSASIERRATSTRCSSASATRARRAARRGDATAPPSSTGCARASRAS